MRALAKLPRPESPLEALLALHLRAERIEFAREVEPIPGRKWRVDFLIAPMIAVECQGGFYVKGGGRHSGADHMVDEYRKLNALTLAGYRVFLFVMAQIRSGEALETIKAAMAARPVSTFEALIAVGERVSI